MSTLRKMQDLFMDMEWPIITAVEVLISLDYVGGIAVQRSNEQNNLEGWDMEYISQKTSLQKLLCWKAFGFYFLDSIIGVGSLGVFIGVKILYKHSEYDSFV